MAYTNKIIYNPHNKQEIKFINTGADTGGSFLEMEATYNSAGNEPPLHYHPMQEEFFTILSGEVKVRINGDVITLTVGDELHLPANTKHSMWNAYEGKSIVKWVVKPAMQTEYFLETAYGLAADGKVNEKGMPPILQSALMLNKFNKVFRLAKPPYYIQKLVFGILKPIALLAGYKAIYKKYLT